MLISIRFQDVTHTKNAQTNELPLCSIPFSVPVGIFLNIFIPDVPSVFKKDFKKCLGDKLTGFPRLYFSTFDRLHHTRSFYLSVGITKDIVE